MSFARKRDVMAENRPDKSEPTNAKAQLKTLASQWLETPGCYTFVDEDFIEVMGEIPSGYARNHGLGVNPSDLDYNGNSNNSDTTTENVHDDEILMLKERVKVMEQNQSEMNATLALLMALVPNHLHPNHGVVLRSTTSNSSIH